jgi:hypothetical protein
MVDERLGAAAGGGGWCRSLPLAEHELLVEFPFAILEVKLQDEAPPWVQELLASGMLTQVAKFSKFLHGTASLRGPAAVRKVPHWWDDPSIRPSSAAAAAMPRIVSVASFGTAGSVDDLGALAGRRGGGSAGGGGLLARTFSAPARVMPPAVALGRPQADTVISVAGLPIGSPARRPSLLRRCLSQSGDGEAAAADLAMKRHVPVKIEPKTARALLVSGVSGGTESVSY